MKKFYFIQKKLLSLLLVLVILFSQPAAIFAADTSRAAKISDLSGTVSIIKSGGEKKFDGFKGMSLAEGDSISTGDDSWVELEIDDDKLVKIDENTQLGVSELQGSIESGDDQTGLKLWFGKVWTNIKNKLNVRAKYEIRTPKTVMGVRGTQFFVGTEGGKTVVAVYEGRVYTVAYTSEQRPDGSVLEQAIEGYIEQNQQVQIDENTVGDTGFQVQPADLNALPRSILEQIRDNPEGLDQEILQNINQVIEEKKAEEAQQKQNQQNEQQSPQAQEQIIPDPKATNPGSISGGGGGGSNGGNPGEEGNPGTISIDIAGNFSIPLSSSATYDFTVSPSDVSVEVLSNTASTVAKDFTIVGSGAERTLRYKPQSLGTTTVTLRATRTGYSTLNKTINITVIPYLKVTPELVADSNGYVIPHGSSTTLTFNKALTAEGKSSVEEALNSDLYGIVTYSWDIVNGNSRLEIQESSGSSADSAVFALDGSIECTILAEDGILYEDFVLITKSGISDPSGPITGLTALPANNSVILKFPKPEGASNVVVEKSIDDGSTWTPAACSPAITADSVDTVVNDLVNGQDYSFRLDVTGGTKEGISNIATVSPDPNSATYVFAKKFGSSGSGNGEFNSNGLLGIAMDSSDNLYVTDRTNRIQIFDPEGNFIDVLTPSIDKSIDFDGHTLTDVAISPDGNIFATDTDVENRGITEFDTDGANIYKWGTNKVFEPFFSDSIYGLAVSVTESVYVVDKNRHRIKVYTPPYIDQYSSFIGTADTVPSGGGQVPIASSSEGEFYNPMDLCFDSSGNIYVTDTENNRIQKFSPTGSFLFSIGSEGASMNGFNSPYGIVCDEYSSVYITDTNNHRIKKYDSEGQLLTTWGQNGSEDGFLNTPRGIAIDSGGNIYVADALNNRIQKYKPSYNQTTASSEDNYFTVSCTAGPSQFKVVGNDEQAEISSISNTVKGSIGDVLSVSADNSADIKVINLPEGLSLSAEKTGEHSIGLTLSGTATEQISSDGISFQVVVEKSAVLETTADTSEMIELRIKRDILPAGPNILSVESDVSGKNITVAFDKEMMDPAGDASCINVYVDDVIKMSGVTSAALDLTDARKINLQLNAPVLIGGHTITLSFFGGSNLQSADGGPVEAFEKIPVVNNSSVQEAGTFSTFTFVRCPQPNYIKVFSASPGVYFKGKSFYGGESYPAILPLGVTAEDAGIDFWHDFQPDDESAQFYVSEGYKLAVASFDSEGKVLAYKVVSITQDDYNTYADPVEGYSVAPSSAAGSSVITYSPGQDNHLHTIVSTTYIDTPIEGADATDIGQDYTSGSEISNLQVGWYIGLYEVDGSHKVVRFSCIGLTESDIQP